MADECPPPPPPAPQASTDREGPRVLTDDFAAPTPVAVEVIRSPSEVRVVVLTHEITRGGRAKSSVDLSCALAMQGYRATCLAHPRFGVPAHSARELSDAGVELYLLPPGRLSSPATVLRVLGALRRLRPDVVIAHSGPLVGAIAPLKRLYADPQFVFVKRGFWPPRGPAGALLRLASRHVDAVVAVSQAVARFWAENQAQWDASRLFVLPNGVRLPSPGDVPDPKSLRRELGVPEGSRLIGTVGRMGWPRGHHYTILALPLILKSVPDIHLMLAGHGPYLADLRCLAEDLGVKPRVHFLGWREDVFAAFAAMDLFVHALLPESLPADGLAQRLRRLDPNPAPAREGFGRAIAEASAMGVPVVATDAGGPREMVVHGETGLLVPAGDPQAICAAVVELLGHPDTAQSMARAARERVCAEYSLEALGRRYHGLIQRLLTQ